MELITLNQCIKEKCQREIRKHLEMTENEKNIVYENLLKILIFFFFSILGFYQLGCFVC